MDFRILRYFLNVAKEQSFTKAAQQLHITQPTLSRQLAALEEELGVTLFARSSRNITLTEEGILFKRRALEILDLEERTLDELKATIFTSVPASACFIFISRFLLEYCRILVISSG